MRQPKTPLRRADMDPQPFLQFDKWFKEAQEAGLPEPEGAALATASKTSFPSIRMILLKGYGQSGFEFYTNYQSRKAVELTENPVAALMIYWPALGRQIRIEGPVKPLPEERSDRYFQSRSRSSRIGAWASPQSQIIADRNFLQRRYETMAQRYTKREVPRPPGWGGFRLTPDRFEYWQQGEHRLHDRFMYLREGRLWSLSRLAP